MHEAYTSANILNLPKALSIESIFRYRFIILRFFTLFPNRPIAFHRFPRHQLKEIHYFLYLKLWGQPVYRHGPGEHPAVRRGQAARSVTRCAAAQVQQELQQEARHPDQRGPGG